MDEPDMRGILFLRHTGPMDKALDSALVWFRRDLRSDDHAALFHALKAARQVWCAFCFDTAILDPLPRADRRVEFIRDSVQVLDGALRRWQPQGGLIVLHGAAVDEIARLAQGLHVQAVYANHDDEPEALARDARARGTLADLGIALHTSKDHVIFERQEILTGSGSAYTVFTPYKNAWLKKLEPFYVSAYRIGKYADALAPLPQDLKVTLPTLADLGFEPTNLHEMKLGLGETGAQDMLADFLPRMDRYDTTRDFPAVKGPSYLSTHLRFGTVSIRQLAREAASRMHHGSRGAAVWLSELVWRDFYHQVLHHHPHIVRASFKAEYDAIQWERGKHAEALFAAWCEGRTGYPLVDAAMAQLNQTGYMHNRLRMVVASFLVKDLGIDWRWGERYFAAKLIDYDLAANNGGWQWAASTGCDAQPYFRIFNPVSQSEKFDPEGKFIRRYVPQLAKLSDNAIHAPWLAKPIELADAGVKLGDTYPPPIVMHDVAREKTLQRYAVVKRTK
jgi:deoxyribodipyrimidine photo-lyase